MEFTNCRRCGRKLHSASSREIGYGKVCLWRIRRALPRGASQAQVDKALDLINDGGLVSMGDRFKNKVYRVVASKGDDFYLTATIACSCPAGRASRLCYHRVAVAWVTA